MSPLAASSSTCVIHPIPTLPIAPRITISLQLPIPCRKKPPIIPRPMVAVHPRRSFQRHSRGVWEDVAVEDDYDSEEEDDCHGSGGGRNEEFESEEETGIGSVVNAYTAEVFNDELVREVELLLSPEEKAIMERHRYPDLSKISTVKWSLFHDLALASQIPLMDKLLDLGVDIDSVDKDGFTALHKAVIGKKEAVISHLLRKGANPHVCDRDGATPLHYAVQVGAMQTVKLLIKYKVDVNVSDHEGWTPLHLAVQSRSRDIAKVLLVNGADKTRRTKDGKTPLDLSLCYGKEFKSYDLAKLIKLVPADRVL